MLSGMVWNEDIVGVLVGCSIPIVAIIGAYCYKIAKVTSDNELKRSMIESGMSAEEIERVLAAKSSDPKK